MPDTTNYSVEQRLLSTMFHRPSQIQHILFNMYFTDDPRNQEIAAAIEMVHSIQPDNKPENIYKDVREHVSEETYDYVLEIYNKVPPVPDVYDVVWPKKLEEEAIELIKYFILLYEEEREGKEQIEVMAEWLDYFRTRITNIQPIPYAQYKTKETFRKWIQDWEQKPGGSFNIFTGFSGWDQQLKSGLKHGSVYALSGEAHLCTDVLLRMVHYIANEHSILYCSLKNNYQAVVHKLMLLASGLTEDTFKPHIHDIEFRNNLADKGEKFFENLVIYHTALPHWQELKETIYYYRKTEEFSYTLLMVDDIFSFGEFELNPPEVIVSELKKIAEDLHIIILLTVPLDKINMEEPASKNKILSVADVVMCVEEQNNKHGENYIKVDVIKSGEETLEGFKIKVLRALNTCPNKKV
ncbi:MAG: hypothetical protein ACR2KB_00810 [Chitinophagaceae bacterium]